MKTTKTVFGLLVVTVSLAVPVHAQSWLTNGLVASYPFNGNANDASGNGNNGTNYNALLTTDRFENPNAAYDFNGTNAYIAIPENAVLNALTTNFTLSVWIWQKGTIPDGYRILDKETAGVADGWTFDTYNCSTLTGHRLRLQTGANNNSCNLNGNTDYSLMVWHHVVVTVSATTGNLYLDGTPDGSGDVGNISANTLDVYIGLAHGSGIWFNGIIDDVRIYNRALSASEVQQLYAYESAPRLTDGLVAYYPFSGNANDVSGNGNNGAALNVGFATNRFGTSLSAAYFTGSVGTNSTVDCSPLNNLPYYPLSYSCWFILNSNLVLNADYPSSRGGAIMTVVGREQSDTGNVGGALALVSSEVFLGITNSICYVYNGAQVFACRFQPAVKTWYHSVVTIDDAGAIKLYINGSLAETFAANLTDLLGTGQPLPFRISGSTYNPLINPTGNPGAPRYSWRGGIDDVRIYSRALSATEVQQLFAYESGPRVDLIKAVKPSFSNLWLGTNYQLQVSGDMNTWTNQGPVFTATNTSMVYPQYWDVDNWNELFFRLQVAQ